MSPSTRMFEDQLYVALFGGAGLFVLTGIVLILLALRARLQMAPGQRGGVAIKRLVFGIVLAGTGVGLGLLFTIVILVLNALVHVLR